MKEIVQAFKQTTQEFGFTGFSGFTGFFEAFQSGYYCSPTMQEIGEIATLSSDGITDPRAEVIMDTEFYRRLEPIRFVSLQFQLVNQDPKVIDLIMGIIALLPIQVLDISDNDLGERAVKVAKILAKSSSLIKLDIGGNKLGQHAVKVAEMLAQSSIIKLDISDNDLGEHAVKVAENFIKNKSILSLNIKSNGLDENCEIKLYNIFMTHINCHNYPPIPSMLLKQTPLPPEIINIITSYIIRHSYFSVSYITDSRSIKKMSYIPHLKHTHNPKNGVTLPVDLYSTPVSAQASPTSSSISPQPRDKYSCYVYRKSDGSEISCSGPINNPDYVLIGKPGQDKVTSINKNGPEGERPPVTGGLEKVPVILGLADQNNTSPPDSENALSHQSISSPTNGVSTKKPSELTPSDSSAIDPVIPPTEIGIPSITGMTASPINSESPALSSPTGRGVTSIPLHTGKILQSVASAIISDTLKGGGGRPTSGDLSSPLKKPPEDHKDGEKPDDDNHPINSHEDTGDHSNGAELPPDKSWGSFDTMVGGAAITYGLYKCYLYFSSSTNSSVDLTGKGSEDI